ncbi:DMT family transporter [Stutzerimonas tarimensis]|uniref:DMT family transporter n=1 Tax=Stutzerimonas tarimensis TaxID=1507735 RepID=A0ABV7T2E3_9GAMM
MLAFAGNSLLTRAALRDSGIDAASFTGVRLAAGALTLWLLLRVQSETVRGNWRSGLTLFAYAAAFSYAYLSLDAGAGALLLFGAVQLTMALAGWRQGERLGSMQTLGLLAAMGGLVVLLLPGSTAPPMLGALLMIGSGIAWGFYSLLGRGGSSPLAVTAGNFIYSLPFALVLALAFHAQLEWSAAGILYAVLAGGLTSGIGYAMWYTAIRGLGAFQAASVQLSVPVIAALGGALLLAEPLTLRLMVVSLIVLGGIALMLRPRAARQ